MAAININNLGAGADVTLTNPGNALRVNGNDVALLQFTQTWTGRQYLQGSTSNYGALIRSALEVNSYSASGASGTTVLYTLNNPLIFFYAGNSTGNWGVDIRGSVSISLNTAMATNNVLTIVFLANQGSTAYYPTSFAIEGTTAGVSLKWLGGSAPTSGNANSIDAYTYTIIKTASNTYTVLASQSRFA